MSSSLKPGARPSSEAQLSSDSKVGRATVREALRALGGNGLISKRRGSSGGSFVETFDHESPAAGPSVSMDAILRLGRIIEAETEYVRQALEVPAAELAAKNRMAEQIAGLEWLLEGERGLDPDDPHVGAFDLEFHSKIAAASGNRVLHALFTGLARALRGSAPPPPIKYHGSGGEVDTAGTVMASHISYFGEMGQTESSSRPITESSCRPAGVAGWAASWYLQLLNCLTLTHLPKI
ncbi:HTH-type transcriptional regulator LutR [Streptomyces jeddahensis]|uniref:HTH-type transcriptional regulator LutR n=2 Tax=Streptomyces jeddahensis TaxID=1716141 RepID=A0A177HM61_9ACTN|nr:HTH-type transcriptional regulator LutR [Streptomyces jeddahensis]